MTKRSYWTNHSVLALAAERDPIEEITRRVHELVVKALDSGWSGPPFDPLALADILGIAVSPTDDVRDARLVVVNGQTCIQYNPNRPRGRMRYSIAHEIAHTLFPDYKKEIRNRESHSLSKGDNWQLESLCNLAAAELLMPAASFGSEAERLPPIERLMELRREYDVSVEALFRRFVRNSGASCAMFCASKPVDIAQYQIDYVTPSQTWSKRIAPGTLLPRNSIVRECVAIGYTAKGAERWGSALDVHIQCVGVPPYPDAQLPRVVGILTTSGGHEREPALSYLLGSALEPRGEGNKMIVHLVNDKTVNWGGAGFAVRLARKWPSIQVDFREWGQAKGNLQLGNVHFADADSDVIVASLVAQKGYGPSPRPRLRYEALRACLEVVAREASARRASVHMPRIGTGQAGGSWNMIEELVRSSLCDAGVRVTVYDLPNGGAAMGTGARSQRQLSLLN